MPADLIELAGVVSANAERMSPESRSRMRGRVMAVARADAATSLQRALFIRAAAIFTAGATLLGGVSYASAAALPGDLLYGFKRGAENAAIAILPDGALERQYLFEVANRRAEETRRLVALGADPADVQRALDEFGAALQRANQSGSAPSERAAVAKSQARLVERVRSMTGDAREKLEAEIHEALGEPDEGGGSGADTTAPGAPLSPDHSSSTVPGGSGSSGTAPQPDGSDGSQGGGAGPGGANDTGVGGSSETTGGQTNHRGP